MKTKKSVYTLKSIFPISGKDGYKWDYETDDENNFKCFVDDVGVFSSIKSAENAIATLVGNKAQENIKWKNWETYIGFIVEEHYIDDSVNEFGDISHFESYRSYLSNGTLNCVSECDERCNKKFSGTKYPNIHVKKGDIALVFNGRKLIPVLVESTSVTKEEWKNRMKPGTYGDYTDDSGLVFTAYNGHMHPFAPLLFPISCLPKARIEKDVIKKMKVLRKGYFKGTML